MCASMMRLTVWHSVAASAPPTTFKKPTISRAKRSAAMPCSALRHLSFACHPYVPTTPPCSHTCTTGVGSESHASGITPCTTGLERNYVQHTTRLPTTSALHHELSYHTLHNGQSAQRTFVPRLHNGRLHDGGGTTGVLEARFAAFHQNMGCRSRSPDAERPGVQLPRARCNSVC
jgi:hypothetical protein